MIHVSWHTLVAGLLFSSVGSFTCGGTIAATRPYDSVEVKLDHVIPQEKSGLNEFTAPEHQPSANGITGLLVAAQSTEINTPAQSDRSQWRRLQRRMSKEDVRKLLGEPIRVSVSRFYEVWDYPRGTIIFDGKGRVDSWSEL
jgi:hypothetical protein